MSETRLSLSDARALIVQTLLRCRTSESNAHAVADALLAAELAGQFGHGMRRIPAYADQALIGKVDGFAIPTAQQTRPGALYVDAAHGFAYPALDLALDWLPGAARANGIAIAGIHRSHHCGVAGVPVEKLAEQGIIGLLVANAPASMAPWGGDRPLFGTDPIAFAAPIEGADPVVIDISLSKVARGKIMTAAQKDEPIPEGWALDADGNPTTDPHAALKGNMLPMGDNKGIALAIMVEMLCAGLTNANYGYETTPFLTSEGGPPATGQTLIAIDAGVFGSHATARFAALAGEIEGMEGARLPGRRRQAIRRQITADGIAVDAALLRTIDAIAR
ncbi:Ldh family oxidoreductase [Pseudooceanicola sediminis]|uniref:Ldh family oxidoreductase n=1 Tax=Pseudooceanicola sediminis TaxID=2211117 RepID=A0A399J6V1_9RHOB|nr:Ldh family oxidoreductase [Pseudooceanicola sediminis]KAA2315517.1 Ldh family oxidoreductase [Puniceibacterium sp. HSS470]RII40277.1 Ldh family oxidoreductase [Pseudooceanicola sediminis]|tara:strand:+ start:80403 stop:81404 length:1002 start_codon:yes stop_codon:yes gene_type:complete